MSFWVFIAIIVVCGPIAKALAVRIRSGDAGDPAALGEYRERLDEMERRMEDTTARVAELEERLDFTERMLAQQKARQQLNP